VRPAVGGGSKKARVKKDHVLLGALSTGQAIRGDGKWRIKVATKRKMLVYRKRTKRSESLG